MTALRARSAPELGSEYLVGERHGTVAFAFEFAASRAGWTPVPEANPARLTVRLCERVLLSLYCRQCEQRWQRPLVEVRPEFDPGPVLGAVTLLGRNWENEGSAYVSIHCPGGHVLADGKTIG